jgi:predicted ribosome quality control (RQC) complex YloA/Tae2 family protein
MKSVIDDYEKFRWFFTSTGKLVIGGKSSEQNDDLLKKLKKEGNEYVVMHTSSPGSPFAVIMSDPKHNTKTDLEETAIFTGSFSRAWREGKVRTTIDIFTLSQLHKSPQMKVGTWGVKGKKEKTMVSLELVLTKQKKKLRSVPEKTAKKKDIILKLRPGKVDKYHMLAKFQMEIKEHLNQEELLSALPPGGISIVR